MGKLARSFRRFGAGDGVSRPVIPPYLNVDQAKIEPGGGIDMPIRPEQPDIGPLVIGPTEPAYNDPIHLTASAVINSSSQGGVNTEALKNPTGAPMEIMEVKWQLRSNAPILTNGMASGGVMACRLMLNKVPLTNGFVPIWLMGRDENYLADSPELAPISPTAIQTGASVPIEFSWKFPRPLFVPAGAVLEPSFQHRGVTQGPVAVQVSYSGRTLPAGAKPPEKICIPWAASYVSTPFQMTVAGTDQSRETDLVNPFSTPVHLQRFIGRLAVTGLQAIGPGGPPPTTTVYSDLFERVATLDFTVTMADSYGNIVIRNPATVFRQAFGGQTRSWECHALMPPKGFYTVLVQHAARATAATFQITRQCHIGLTGWRELSWSEL